MLENVTNTAVVEDCFNLMFASDQICDAFKEAGRDHLNFAQFGSITSSGDKFAVQLLEKYRTNWDAHKKVEEEIGFRSAPLVPKTQAESILAFVLGWLCHRAVGNQLKPDSTEAGLYQDAFIFGRLYMNNSPASAAIGSQELAELFRALQQRFLIEMHTFVPDVEDIEGWFDKLHVKYRERTAYMDLYAEAVMNPDPAKEKQFVSDTNFYDDGDAVIQLAQALRKGVIPSQQEIEAAIAAEPKSRYARALKQGYGSLLSANAFFSGIIDQQKLNDLLAV
ncbi:MAG: hypothetical protein K0S39_5817 [Paenibacillus sp.]|jgi:hypothetical protein|nr:hypothetical protein [Paenibacillus sp.]